MNTLPFLMDSPSEIDKAIAQRMKAMRKKRKLTQKALSEKADVSLGSLKRFETTGEISLKSLTKIAIVLDCRHQLYSLFEQKAPTSIQEIIDGQD